MNSDARSDWPITLRRHARAKRMRLRLDPRRRTVLLTIPPRASERRALAWAAGQGDWIAAAIASVGADPIPLAPGCMVPLYGEPHLLSWEPRALRAVRVEPGRILVGGPSEQVPSRTMRWLRSHALSLLKMETHALAATADVTVAQVGIGDPLSRWGSCSTSGAIRYSWRLILAPEWVRRATVAHEVAHRVHMNHGPAFHALVAQLFGADPGPARDWLRRHGASLHRFGLG